MEWLKLGDNNSAFFGMMSHERKWKNSLYKVTDGRGKARMTVGEVKEKCIDYFGDLYAQQEETFYYLP